jgi:hypothetical protein
MDVYCDSTYLATLFSLTGDHEEAILWLEESLAQGSSWVVEVAVDPVFDPLRDDPRFQQIVESLRIPE